MFSWLKSKKHECLNCKQKDIKLQNLQTWWHNKNKECKRLSLQVLQLQIKLKEQENQLTKEN
jgi:hypothetical protein